MKITRKIKPDKFFSVLKLIQENFGFPEYYEDLTIYLSRENFNIKLSVKANAGIVLSYRDKSGKSIADISLKSNELKNVLAILKAIVGNTGYISISPVFEFTKDESTVSLIKDSLIGSIVVMNEYSPSPAMESALNDYCYEDDHKPEFPPLEKVIDFDISQKGILNEKLISYIERNGIHLNRNRKTTYRDILESKSNDYSNYASVFSLVTNQNLLDRNPLFDKNLPNLSSVTASIIIPCFNTEKTINRVLDVIKYQSANLDIKELEVILIDDGSSKSVNDFISDKTYPFRLQIIRLEKNGGLSNARNIGVNAAGGDILIFLDSDILLEKNYIREHLVRNVIVSNAVFVSFKENTETTDPRISVEKINSGLEMPDYSKDLRVSKLIRKDAIGSYKVSDDTEVEILESTNYFKSFSGSRVFGVYDLSCMIIGHNFSARKDTITKSSPFTHKLTGWGMEDVYFGLKLINNGSFIIPVLSTGVYHINHPPRSGSDKEKIKEYKHNTEIIDQILDTEIDDSGIRSGIRKNLYLDLE